ncbi:hypothetical protein NY2A_b151R [Paramecium bursaria Chlorella virus NY2A]|uniref:Uncharacterized protein b151R n=1 Tax=Paramecium bursaria Chlorella virus NY2A TaxID=46021 RepID=A7IW26_PBCVN|nr:hypothetical protein NY2A_b151R [Paramecium bursaria Chlorella virus NY2A]ABT14550.1 hypothetical protein NY2A_b151R [Paramecium bursaria Chlorella virus NY2A]
MNIGNSETDIIVNKFLHCGFLKNDRENHWQPGESSCDVSITKIIVDSSVDRITVRYRETSEMFVCYIVVVFLLRLPEKNVAQKSTTCFFDVLFPCINIAPVERHWMI